MPYVLHYASPFGPLHLISAGQALDALLLPGQPAPSGETPHPELPEALLFASDWLDRYFGGARPAADELPSPRSGTPFQQAVWTLLCAIPYGETVSYGALAAQTAARLHKPCMSAQAVGGALGRNPVPIIVPCHRVIGVDGSLVGYGGGLALKARLLRHEGIVLFAADPLKTARIGKER